MNKTEHHNGGRDDTVRSPEYYTPTKADLIYGLEFEETHNGFDWTKKVADDDLYMGMEEWSGDMFDLIICSFYQPASDDSHRVRVKYLDESDIEAIGGILSHEEKGNPNKMYYFGKNSLVYNCTNRWCIITIRNDERQEDYTAYVGTIKNKSELKRIFENLGAPINTNT